MEKDRRMGMEMESRRIGGGGWKWRGRKLGRKGGVKGKGWKDKWWGWKRRGEGNRDGK